MASVKVHTTARKLIAAGMVCLSTSAMMVAGVDKSAFPELVANPFEARIGSMYQVSDKAVRLDIGASLDVYEEQGPWTQSQLSFGVDFMTWTRLRSEGNFKFPVETIDYWFGVNAKMRFGTGPWAARMRVAHISSHLADGVADTAGTLSPKPFVYSREFIELIMAREIGVLRPYAGVTAVWATQPDNPNPFIPQIGCDVRLPFGGEGSPWQLRGGYDMRLIGIDGTYAAANALQLGVMHLNRNETAWSFNLYGYSGRSMHGLFYTKSDDYISLGFQFLW